MLNECLCHSLTPGLPWSENIDLPGNIIIFCKFLVKWRPLLAERRRFVSFPELAIFSILFSGQQPSITQEIGILHYFHIWCSGACRTTHFHIVDCLPDRQFSLICHLAHTKASCMKSSFLTIFIYVVLWRSYTSTFPFFSNFPKFAIFYEFVI